MRPIVAVLGYGSKNPASAFSYPADILNAAYSTSLIKVGAIPFLVPSCEDEDIIKDTVSHVDGILIPGGLDVDPSLYEEKQTEYTKECNKEMDLFQMHFIREAIRQNKAIMGICRGFQVINVFFGGTLYQDVMAMLPSDINHKNYDFPEGYAHSVTLNKGSLINNALRKDRLSVNSLHHQGVKKLGNELYPSAYSPDGLIEGFENKKLKLIAVQWHPEALVMANESDSLKLFHIFSSMLGA